MSRMTVTMFNAQQGHQALLSVWMQAKAMLTSGHRMVLSLAPETRSLAQNARLWAMLTDISKQVDWYGKKLSPEDWKHIFTSSLKKLDVVPNLDGTGFVALGLSTSKMTKAEMCDMQTLMEAFGAEKGVKFSEPEWVDQETGEVLR
jgi:hypothetical protein